MGSNNRTYRRGAAFTPQKGVAGDVRSNNPPANPRFCGLKAALLVVGHQFSVRLKPSFRNASYFLLSCSFLDGDELFEDRVGAGAEDGCGGGLTMTVGRAATGAAGCT